jgi:hypothetical protein
MDSQQAKKILSLFLATQIKFREITPFEIVEDIKEYCSAEGTPSLPVSIQPYTESIKLWRNILRLSSYLEEIVNENLDYYHELSTQFDEIGEEGFVKWYREQRSQS